MTQSDLSSGKCNYLLLPFPSILSISTHYTPIPLQSPNPTLFQSRLAPRPSTRASTIALITPSTVCISAETCHDHLGSHRRPPQGPFRILGAQFCTAVRTLRNGLGRRPSPSLDSCGSTSAFPRRLPVDHFLAWLCQCVAADWAAIFIRVCQAN